MRKLIILRLTQDYPDELPQLKKKVWFLHSMKSDVPQENYMHLMNHSTPSYKEKLQSTWKKQKQKKTKKQTKKLFLNWFAREKT